MVPIVTRPGAPRRDRPGPLSPAPVTPAPVTSGLITSGLATPGPVVVWPVGPEPAGPEPAGPEPAGPAGCAGGAAGTSATSPAAKSPEARLVTGAVAGAGAAVVAPVVVYLAGMAGERNPVAGVGAAPMPRPRGPATAAGKPGSGARGPWSGARGLGPAARGPVPAAKGPGPAANRSACDPVSAADQAASGTGKPVTDGTGVPGTASGSACELDEGTGPVLATGGSCPPVVTGQEPESGCSARGSGYLPSVPRRSRGPSSGKAGSANKGRAGRSDGAVRSGPSPPPDPAVLVSGPATRRASPVR
jgi:hypothetical protein